MERTAREVEVELDALELDPENVRSQADSSVVEGLREALRVSGDYINAPVVYATEEGRYRVQHGATRVIAAKGVVTSLRVRVKEAPPSARAKTLSQLSENLLQSGLGPIDIGRALRNMRDEGDLSIGQIVGALKAAGVVRSRAWVIRHIGLTELDAEVQAAVANGSLQMSQALQLRPLSPQDQRFWAQRIVEEGIGAQTLERLLGHEGGAADRVDPFLETREQRTQRADEIDAEMRDRLLGLEDRRPTRAPAARPDADHRDGAVRSRWEFLPLLVEPAKKTAGARKKLQTLERHEWLQTADRKWRRLAEEAFLLGNLTPEEAISLCQAAEREEEVAWEPIMVTLHGLRMLAENPDRLERDSALAAFLKVRMRRVLSNLM